MLQKYGIPIPGGSCSLFDRGAHRLLWQTKLKNRAAALPEGSDGMEASPPPARPQPGQGGLPSSAICSLFLAGIGDAQAAKRPHHSPATGDTLQPSATQLEGGCYTLSPNLGSAPLAKLYLPMENNRVLCLPKVEIIPIERHLTGT